ncbi:hypothetical protein [uncultured Bradyrhizobium sp.]|jgi:hypothetical protein|uniref:hypothetical protein n=1 Tax=uncultured Bradyrhizobium sp. TaxID=199684 RepID=UPI00262864E1|nr:hypothetical protein [uncultured Bradyrhizobium sp.]
MADNQSALKITQTWARAATVTSSHERDYFVEAIREMQREKEASRRPDDAPQQKSG